jgi:hypothetical protein
MRWYVHKPKIKTMSAPFTKVMPTQEVSCHAHQNKITQPTVSTVGLKNNIIRKTVSTVYKTKIAIENKWLNPLCQINAPLEQVSDLFQFVNDQSQLHVFKIAL